MSKHETRYEIGEGGGWLGYHSVPIIRHLFDSEGHPTGRGGTSVNALNESMAAMEAWDELEALWADLADPFVLDGIKGYLNLSLRGGVFSTRPMEHKISQYMDHTAFKCPVAVGVTSRAPVKHYTLWSTDAQDHTQWNRWVLASASIAFLMKTVPGLTLPDGAIIDGRDGGHTMGAPALPPPIRGEKTVWDVLLHHPLRTEEMPKEDKCGKLVSELKWLLKSHFQAGHRELLDRLDRAVRRYDDLTVRLWAPDRSLGDMLGAGKDDIAMRAEIAQETIRRGPTILS